MILLRKFRQRLVAIRRMLGLSAVLREGAACREGGRMSAPAGRLAVDRIGSTAPRSQDYFCIFSGKEIDANRLRFKAKE